MITNIVVRHALNIHKENEIANFSNRYGISSNNVSAISWEASNSRRNISAENLIKDMIIKLDESNSKYTMTFIELSSLQPKSAIIKYKKTWGLLDERGVNCNSIKSKKNYSIDFNDGLALFASGIVNLKSEGVFQSLMNTNDNVYFSVTDEVPMSLQHPEYINKQHWMEDVWGNDGVILMPLGYADDSSCEIVALGKDKELEVLNVK